MLHTTRRQIIEVVARNISEHQTIGVSDAAADMLFTRLAMPVMVKEKLDNRIAAFRQLAHPLIELPVEIPDQSEPGDFEQSASGEVGVSARLLTAGLFPDFLGLDLRGHCVLAPTEGSEYVFDGHRCANRLRHQFPRYFSTYACGRCQLATE